MISIRTVGIALCVALSHTVLAFASATPVTVTHSYVLGDDDSRNSARQKCLAEAKRKILEQVGVYLESESELLTSSRSTTSGSAKAPQTTSEDRQQLTERITALTAGLMRTDVVKEEFGEVNGRLQITLTVKAEVDPDDMQKQLAARRADRSVTKQVTEQERRLALIEARLRAMDEQQEPSSQTYREAENKKTVKINPGDIATERTLANLGDPFAQLSLGLAYSEGRGVPKSDTDAVAWYRKAAEQIGVWAQHAQTQLGNSYSSGKGVPQSDTEAVKWWRKAAEAGLAYAQYQIGQQYYMGRGVSQSDTEAVKWWRKAAEQGDAYAQRHLGGMYRSGRGVPQSDADTVVWYRRAADQGNSDAQKYLGEMYLRGEGVPQSVTEAVKWWRKAADQGDAEAKGWVRFPKYQQLVNDQAKSALFVRYEQGRDVLESDLEVMYWTSYMATKHGDAEASNWFRKAAQEGNANAQVALGYLYSQGRHSVPRSQSDAIAWFLKAANTGHALAQLWLGAASATGWEEAPENFVDGYIWCHRAATSTSDEELKKGATRCERFCAKQMSPSLLSDVKHTAENWKPTLAD